jgi:S-methylmethionine-dependent homocysteine/selenocysteine methylase
MSNARPALPSTPVVLDGGMGRELRFRGVEILDSIWSANGLITAPEIVRAVHDDYIAAGADIITTNSYGVIRAAMATLGIEERFEELNRMSGELAVAARDAADRDVWIAGSLPPLNGSYRADLVQPRDVIEPLYREQAELLAPYVDLFLCETMASGDEALAAATAAASTGKPVWVSYTLHEDQSGRLRSGETVAEAWTMVAGLPVTGLLANCCAPESIAAALAALKGTGVPYVGGYANTFLPVPESWTLDGDEATDGVLPLRSDLEPDAYLGHARAWWSAGATVVGGCCGTRPAHIAAIARDLGRAAVAPQG